MKKHFRYLTGVLTLLLGVILLSCDDEESGTPLITNVRVTLKDSAIVGGQFNLTVAIQGTNLGDVNKVLFNDVEAELNPVYVTNKNIICAVPDDAPTQVTNKITVFTTSGASASFDFKVILPEPVVQAVYNEFAKPGATNYVFGNYFYVISKVMVGETEVEIKEITPTAIEFIMPEVSGGETVTVVGEGGTVESTFKLHDTSGNMVNFDIPATTWGSAVCWGSAEIVAPANSDIEPVSGKYTRIKQNNLAKTGWQDDWVLSTCWFDFSLPAGSHETKMLKFEVNVVEPWKAGFYEINLSADGKTYTYIFKPWDNETYKSTGFKTRGWMTVYVPLSNFRNGSNQIANIANIRDFQFVFKTPDAAIAKHHVAADNFRIVDK